MQVTSADDPTTLSTMPQQLQEAAAVKGKKEKKSYVYTVCSKHILVYDYIVALLFIFLHVQIVSLLYWRQEKTAFKKPGPWLKSVC